MEGLRILNVLLLLVTIGSFFILPNFGLSYHTLYLIFGLMHLILGILIMLFIKVQKDIWYIVTGLVFLLLYFFY